MDVTICPECGASEPGVQPACSACGWPKPDHIADLLEGEVIYGCGQCRKIRRLRADENPEQTHKQFARGLKGESLYLPLTVWNTVFRCDGCHRWNWITLDDRITAFEMPCPECGTQTRLASLGKHFGFSRDFLKPIMLGELRLGGKPVTLKCGHLLYLPNVVIERKPSVEAEAGAALANADSAAAARSPKPPTTVVERADSQSATGEKKKTQPLSLLPPEQ